MATINLLPWRDGLREQRKTIYYFMFWGRCFGITTVFAGWFYLNQN